MEHTKEEAKDIATHVEMLLDDEMRAHACADREAHDLPFQIFRVLGGYREALDELSSLRAALAEKTAQAERLREALIDFKDLTSRHVQWTAHGREMKFISARLEKIDEALAATAPDA